MKKSEKKEMADIYVRLIRDGEGEEVAEGILLKLRATKEWFIPIEFFTEEEQTMLKALGITVCGEERHLSPGTVSVAHAQGMVRYALCRLEERRILERASARLKAEKRALPTDASNAESAPNELTEIVKKTVKTLYGLKGELGLR